MAITTKGTVWALTDGFSNTAQKVFGTTGSKVSGDHESQFDKVFEITRVNQPVRRIVEFAGPGEFERKDENVAVGTSAVAQSGAFTVTTVTYAAALAVTEEAAEDAVTDVDKMSSLENLFTSLEEARGQTYENVSSLFLDRAFDTNYPVVVNQEVLCSASHLTPLGGQVSSNIITAAALSEESVESMMIAMRENRNASGNKSQLKMKDLVVPSQLFPTASKLRTTEKQTGSNFNNDSFIAGQFGVQVLDNLGSTTRWFATTKGFGKGNGLFFNFIKENGRKRDENILQLAKVYMNYTRFQIGVVDHRSIFGSNA